MARCFSWTIASRLSFFFFRDLIFEVQRRRVGPARILEAEDRIVLHLIEQPQRRIEIGFRLARESRR